MIWMAKFLDYVLKLRMDGDSEIRRDRPGRRCPDCDRSPSGQRACLNREADIDRGIGPLLILNLSLGESRLGSCAPEDRFSALVDQILFYEICENGQDLRFVRGIQR